MSILVSRKRRQAMTSAELFEKALGITAPWRITQTELRPSADGRRTEMHIDVDFAPGSDFICPVCGEDCKAYDTETKTWRHLNFFQYRCYIHARVPRIKCDRHGVRTVNVPWGREGSGFTLAMESVILAFMQHMPVRTAAREIGETDNRLWRVLKYYTKKLLPTRDFSDVTEVGVDEYSHRGHDYITVFLSHPTEKKAKARVLDIEDGKGNDTVDLFSEVFGRHRGRHDDVCNITMDMTHGYREPMQKKFPNAKVTVDRFHVVKLFSDALDETRRKESYTKGDILNKTRYLWLKNRENLSPEQQSRLDELLKIDHLETVVAYNFKLRVQDMYEKCETRDDAEPVLKSLIEDLRNTFSIYLKWSLPKTLKRNFNEILNYFDSKLTNAILEGFNSVISIIKNRARGFRNMENFKNMIYFCLGQLDFPKALIMA